MRGGLLWIWPDDSTSAFEESSRHHVAIPDDVADFFEQQIEQGIPVGFTRIVPYDFELLMENLLDPAHFPFAHHGSTPLANRKDGAPVFMRPAEPSLSTASHAAFYKGHTRKEMIRLELLDKCSGICFRFPSEKEGVSDGHFFSFGCPVRDGVSRILAISLFQGRLSGHAKSSILDFITKHFPWVIHLNQLAILDGDNVFLHGQDRQLREKGNWTRQIYYTPTSSDAMVLEFRQWLATEGGGGPFYEIRKTKPFQALYKEDILERFHSHTAECPLCQKGLKFLNRVATVLKLLSIGAFVFTVGLVYSALQNGSLVRWKMAVSIAVFAFCTFVEKMMREKLITQFYFVDYVHAEKN